MGTVALPEALAQGLASLVALLGPLNREIAAADQRIAALVAQDAVMQRLVTAPGIGPVTAAAFVATLDDVTRFRSAGEVMAYGGLVPSEDSSAERRQRGAITKAGNARVRWLLVEAAWSVRRSTRGYRGTQGVRVAPGLTARQAGGGGGDARRLAGILYAMWRDETAFGVASQKTPPSLATRKVA